MQPYRESNLLINISESFSSSASYYLISYNILFFIALIIDIIEQRKKELLPAFIYEHKFIFKPIVPLTVFFIPFIGYFLYFSITRHQITNEEASNFEKTNSYFSGDWYFLNQDSSLIFKFQTSQISIGNKYITGDLDAALEYGLYKNDNEYMGGVTLDSIMNYNSKLVLPFTFKGGTEITSLIDNKLTVKIKLKDGTFLSATCIKDKAILNSIIQAKELEKGGGMTPEEIAGEI